MDEKALDECFKKIDEILDEYAEKVFGDSGTSSKLKEEQRCNLLVIVALALRAVCLRLEE